MSEQVIKDFFDAINQRDYSRIETYLTEDYVYHFDEEQSLAGYQAVFVELLKPYLESGDLTFKITKIEDNGSTFIVWSTKETTKEGDLLEQHTEKFRIQDGKIAEQWMLGRE